MNEEDPPACMSVTGGSSIIQYHTFDMITAGSL